MKAAHALADAAIPTDDDVLAKLACGFLSHYGESAFCFSGRLRRQYTSYSAVVANKKRRGHHRDDHRSQRNLSDGSIHNPHSQRDREQSKAELAADRNEQTRAPCGLKVDPKPAREQNGNPPG